MTQQPYPVAPQPPAGSWIPENPSPGIGLRPVRSLAIAAATVAIGLALAEVLEAALAWPAQESYLEAARNGEQAIDVLTAYDLVGWPLTVALIAAYVLTCLWLYRVRTNAEILHPHVPHARKKGWVWAGWLVPIVSFWFPFQVVRDVREDPDSSRRGSDTLLGWWWAFWLASVFTAQIGTRLIGFGFGFGEINAGAVQALGTVETINAGLTLVALSLWLTLIRRITQDQERAIDATAGRESQA